MKLIAFKCKLAMQNGKKRMGLQDFPKGTKETDFKKVLKCRLNHGQEEMYFFMHMDDEVLSTELTIYLLEKINKYCGLKLKMPVFIQTKLF